MSFLTFFFPLFVLGLSESESDPPAPLASLFLRPLFFFSPASRFLLRPLSALNLFYDNINY